MYYFHKFLLFSAALAFTGTFLSGCNSQANSSNVEPVPSINPEPSFSASQFNCSEDGKTIRANLIQASEQSSSFSVQMIEAIEKAKMVYKDPQCADQRPYFAQVLKAEMQSRVHKSYNLAVQSAQAPRLLCITRPVSPDGDYNSRTCQSEYEEKLRRIESDYRSELRSIDDFFQS